MLGVTIDGVSRYPPCGRAHGIGSADRGELRRQVLAVRLRASGVTVVGAHRYSLCRVPLCSPGRGRRLRCGVVDSALSAHKANSRHASPSRMLNSLVAHA